jgi:T5SS/PEP-CTERM-associated repeat protein
MTCDSVERRRRVRGILARSALAATALWAANTPGFAADRSWINISGGTFTTLSNWQNGLFAGVNDAACFNNSSIFFPPGQTNYTVSFSANAQNQAIKVRNDFVTFNLSGRTYTTTSLAGNEIGTIGGGGSIQTARSARLTIQNGTFTTANNSPFTLGAVAGGLGSLTVTSGATLTGSPRILVGGASATGTLTMDLGGGTILANSVEIGSGSLSNGTANISGPFSKLSTNTLLVGNHGNGTMLITVGAVVQNNGTATIGNASGIGGLVTVDGATARWNQSGSLLIGAAGSGTLNIINGGRLAGSSAVMASPAGSSAAVLVGGPGSVRNGRIPAA